MTSGCAESVHVFGGLFDHYEISATRTGGTWSKKYGADITHWDVAPPPEYFNELFRISRNQIIWGGNYFGLPPTRCFLIWRKLTISEAFSMAMCEYAWTSFDDNAKWIELAPQGTASEPRFHPCLPAGEQVFVNGDWTPIERVKVGDATQYGVVSETTCHDAYKIVTIYVGKERTRCTENHPFLVARDGKIVWLEARLIQPGDSVLQSTDALWKLAREFSRKRDMSGATSGARGAAKAANWLLNTFSSTRKRMENLRKVFRFIMLTVFRGTIELKTSSLSRPLNTSGYTEVAAMKAGGGLPVAKIVGGGCQLKRSIGICRADIPTRRTDAGNATSKKSAEIVRFAFQKVGRVQTDGEHQKVYNLTIDGVPAFDTAIGASHNTQKPVKLYSWILSMYAKPGDKVLDTHAGSASSLIACHRAGVNYIGFEIDKTYYEKASARLDAETAQMTLFDTNDTPHG
jgi:hypothetical protein